MGELDNTVALVTGAARGQGRSHCVALASEGADIIAIDICADIDSIPYPLATKEDLDETARLVARTGRRISTHVADVRQLAALEAAVAEGIGQLGEIGIVVANAGVVALGVAEPKNEQVYRDIVETNLFGAWNTIAVSVPSIIRRGRGGSIVLTSSVQGLTGRGGDGSAAVFGYAASKHGLVGLMRSAANAYASDNIRVNTVHPTGVATPMVLNEYMAEMHAEAGSPSSMGGNMLPVQMVEAQDITNAVVWLVSEKARYVTGVALPVDAGCAAM